MDILCHLLPHKVLIRYCSKCVGKGIPALKICFQRKLGLLHWRHNGRDSVSNHQPHDCLLNRLFRRRSKNTSQLRVTGHCVGNSPVTGEFPAQMASNVGNVSIWWRHHAILPSGKRKCVIPAISTETEKSSYWRPSSHWLHRRLSEWQPRVLSVIRRLSIWRPFGFSDPLLAITRHQSRYHVSLTFKRPTGASDA